MGEQELINRKILLAEDDGTVAFQLSDAFVNEGANVMYPIDTIEDALDVIMEERNSSQTVKSRFHRARRWFGDRRGNV
ncbi:MAG: hypothetical protein EOR85_28280 [Mesorhizobium sp.]|uniref:hypothetical protein n=1 Tax=Mesorhizobium sp. TaxID=1871066 RepID=UPI000FE74225|nr:hypothetical protein [Mesorhizobium sp.]RWM48408.1 MAG: hypothetical protein EOR79_32525 [Mesorhizobium sp.]RWM92298.1 MAG: hypothetical protein EOR85_28280 [Mesorhizobium sp.]TIM88837.1 MAG: hypothetical protein E5Y50_07535 [Mesorhizobium sp.]TIN49424.1 MAG: hypothetical protein E5Y32_01770 [Mesorhizobium sp.]